MKCPGPHEVRFLISLAPLLHPLAEYLTKNTKRCTESSGSAQAPQRQEPSAPPPAEVSVAEGSPSDTFGGGGWVVGEGGEARPSLFMSLPQLHQLLSDLYGAQLLYLQLI